MNIRPASCKSRFQPCRNASLFNLPEQLRGCRTQAQFGAQQRTCSGEVWLRYLRPQEKTLSAKGRPCEWYNDGLRHCPNAGRTADLTQYTQLQQASMCLWLDEYRQ